MNYHTINYPIPDPTWPYAALWHELHRNPPLGIDDMGYGETLAYLAEVEKPTPDSDHYLWIALDRLGWPVEKIEAFLL